MTKVWYNILTSTPDGVMAMSIIAGILVCAFVYVIRQALRAPKEEDWESYHS